MSHDVGWSRADSFAFVWLVGEKSNELHLDIKQWVQSHSRINISCTHRSRLWLCKFRESHFLKHLVKVNTGLFDTLGEQTSQFVWDCPSFDKGPRFTFILLCSACMGVLLCSVPLINIENT